MSSPLFLKILLYYLMLMVLAFLVNITFKIIFPFMRSNVKNTFGIYQKEKIIWAKVISKRLYNFEKDNGNPFENYYLTFENKQKKVMEFQVDEYYYNYYAKGEKGTLIYKGENFIDFIREK